MLKNGNLTVQYSNVFGAADGLHGWRKSLLSALLLLLMGVGPAHAGEYQWPAYSPNVAYDFNAQFGHLDPPTQVLPGVSGVDGIYANGWWCFVWGANKNPEVTDADWVPMIERLNTDFAYMTDVMGWPRDKRAQNGYFSTVYLFGSGLSTDSASNTDLGGWMGTTVYNGEPWHCILASYYPVHCFDPAYTAGDKGYQTGAMVHEGIHSIMANMPGCFNSAWTHESFNTWLQGTMESQRSGNFSGMGWLSVGSAIAPFMPIECYTGWLQDGSFGGPSAEGVYQGDGICTWRNLLGGVQYSESFPHALEIILGPKSIPWIWQNCHYSGRVLQDLAEAPNGLGDAQMRRLIQEYRARQAFCDFGQWSYAFRKLLNDNWGVSIEEEYTPAWINVDPWTATCYVATTNSSGTLTPEARTLPGWSGANQIPLTVSPAATNVAVTFNPLGTNMSCQLVYRDTSGAIHYSDPVSSGACSMPVTNVLNNVMVVVVCNTDYIYAGDITRTTKYDYTLTMGAGITGQADIHTKWYDYNPPTYTITASAGAEGAISPSGAIVLANGSSQTFTFTPDPGFAVREVLLNGFTVGAPSSYTINPVLGDHRIEVVFRDATPPSGPTGLGATAVDGSVNLDWADNTEPDIDSYNVYRSTTSGSNYVAIATGVATSDYADNAVVDGTIYYYVVTAVDIESNESTHSAQSSATAIDTIAPAAPTGLTGEGTGNAVVLDWADNSEPDLASYTVYRSTTSGSGYVAIASGLTTSDYTDGTVVLGTTYYYVVTATDASFNESGYSSEATPVSVLLAVWDFNDPSLGAANGAPVPDSDGLNTWRTAAYDKSDNENDLTTWDYQAAAGFTWSTNSVDGDFSIKSAGDYPAAFTWSSQSAPSGTDAELFTGTNFTVEALATVSGSNYYRTVVGRDAQDLATADSKLAALYLGLDDGNHARFQYVDVNGSSIDLRSSSTYAEDDNVFHHFAGTSDGSTASLYVDGALVAQVTGKNLAGLGIGTVSGSGWHAGGWSVGRGLYEGYHSDRWHGYIDSVAIAETVLEPGYFVLSDVVAPPPAAPTGLAATPGDGSVALDWDDNTQPDFDYYTIYRSTTSGGGYAFIASYITTSAYTDPSTANGTTYYYLVTAKNISGLESVYSAVASATPVDGTPPSAPTGLAAILGDGAVNLDWANSGESDLASYTVYRSTTNGSGYVAIASGLTSSAYSDHSVGSGTNYYYVVTAVDTSSNESGYSAQVLGNLNPTVEFWDFEDGTAGSPFTDTTGGASVGSGGSDGVNGTRIYGWDDNVGPYWSSNVGPNGGSLSADFDGNADGYVTGSGTISDGWSPNGWTIEAHISVDTINGYETFISRDGSAGLGDANLSPFYLQIQQDGGSSSGTGTMRINYTTVNNTQWILDGTTVIQAGQWYAVAVVGTDMSLEIWLDDGTGYQLENSIDISSNSGNNALQANTFNWVFGRGWYGGFGDYTDSRMDNVRFSYMALAPERLIPLNPLPTVPTGLSAVGTNEQIVLSWNPASNATSYKVKRSYVSGGPYTVIASNSTTTYTNTGLANGTTYHYVVSAVNADGESANSAQVSASPAFPTPPNIGERIYALTTDNQLISFDSTDPGSILTAHTVSGLQSNEKIVGIDFWNGILYGLGDQNHLYTLNLANGAAGLIGSFSPVMNGEAFGFEAEPGGLRLVSNLDQDLLLNYSTAVAAVGPTINGSPNPALTGLAYHPGNAQIYVADYYQNTIGLLNTGSGLVSTIGMAGIDFSRHNGFDISSNPGNTAYLASPAASSGLAANLYTVDLTTGSASFVGLIGLDGDNTLIRGLSVKPGYVELTATNLVSTVNGGQMTLSWPEDHTGWRLEVQTNSLDVGLSTNWVTVPGSTDTNRIVIPMSADGAASVLYRLVYP